MQWFTKDMVKRLWVRQLIPSQLTISIAEIVDVETQWVPLSSCRTQQITMKKTIKIGLTTTSIPISIRVFTHRWKDSLEGVFHLTQFLQAHLSASTMPYVLRFYPDIFQASTKYVSRVPENVITILCFQTSFQSMDPLSLSDGRYTSVHDHFSNLFVDQWSTKINYTRYSDQCAPSSCTYSTTDSLNFLYTITLLLSLYGGLTAVLRLVAPFILNIALKLKLQSAKGVMKCGMLCSV